MLFVNVRKQPPAVGTIYTSRWIYSHCTVKPQCISRRAQAQHALIEVSLTCYYNVKRLQLPNTDLALKPMQGYSDITDIRIL